MGAGHVVKCVVWDLDDTVWNGVALERADDSLPEPKPEILHAIDVLAERGVLSSIASRTAPALAERVMAKPELADRFVAAQLSWADKSTLLRRIAEELGIAVDSLVLVDDSPYERAEVSAALPEVDVLDPGQVPQLLESIPEAGTGESASRVRLYRDERRRAQAERSFAGTREEFYRDCDMRLSIEQARPEDLDRVLELAERTHRLNSTSAVPDRTWLAGVLADPGWFVPVARLTDVFGDYGMIGAALVRCRPEDAREAWWVRLLALSCRIAGRGVGTAFLRWLMDRAVESGATRIAVDSRPTEANTELRVLFRQCGLRAPDSSGAVEQGGVVTLWRSLDGELPAVPEWLAPERDTRTVEREVRAMLAEATGREAAEIDRLPSGVSLFAPEIGLTSVEGVHLLTAVRQRFGVDIAAEDLNLDALESIDSLCAFLLRER